MVTLALDTSFLYLNVILFDADQHPLASYCKPAVHQQSELLLPTIRSLYESVSLSPNDTDTIVITEGPGSYTGLRIAMTFAKTMALFDGIQIKTINALDLYYGKPDQDGYCIMDARAKRVYMSHYHNGKRDQMGIVPIASLSLGPTTTIMGQGSIVDLKDHYPDFVDSFTYWLNHAQPIDDPNQLAPLYLKESDAYGSDSKRHH